MQLKKKNSIKHSLAIATCSLLSIPADSHAGTFDFDISFLDYTELQDRIRVRETDFGFKWELTEDSNLIGKFITDSITGATPTGALKPPPDTVQTSTSASGVSGTTGIGRGQEDYLSGLAEFVDRRIGFSANFESTLKRLFRYNVGGTISIEDDYSSYSGNALLSYEFNKKLSTVSISSTYGVDISSPEGGPPALLSEIDSIQRTEDGIKEIIDGNIAITQVLNRRTITKLSYSRGILRGYLTDPYKYITLTELVTDGTHTSREKVTYFTEARPDSRDRSSINWDLSSRINDTATVVWAYRYYWDDWKIKSHTFDIRYRRDLNRWKGVYIQPHARYYTQSAAYFYKPYLDADAGEDPEIGDNPVSLASSDYRLDELYTITFGFKVGYESHFGHLRSRIEYMNQNGSQGDYKYLSAVFFQIMYSLKLD